MLPLHPVLQPPQRLLQAIARERVSRERQSDARLRAPPAPAPATYQPPAIQACAAPSPAEPIAKPAAAHRNSTFGLATASAMAAPPALTGVSLPRLCIQPGLWDDRLRVSQR